jgi:hypothetical protein
MSNERIKAQFDTELAKSLAEVTATIPEELEGARFAAERILEKVVAGKITHVSKEDITSYLEDKTNILWLILPEDTKQAINEIVKRDSHELV